MLVVLHVQAEIRDKIVVRIYVVGLKVINPIFD